MSKKPTRILIALVLAVAASGCLKSAKQEALDKGAKPIDAAQAKQVFTGNTFVGKVLVNGANLPFRVFFSPDGRTSGVVMGDRDLGRWRIEASGAVCIKWTRWQDKRELCSVYHQLDKEFRVFMPDEKLASAGAFLPGNPGNLELRTDKEIALEKGGIAQLAAEDAKRELSGNTLTGSLKQLNDAPYHAYYDPAGKVAAKVSGVVTDSDRGQWTIKDSGDVCVKWSKWNGGAESCAPLYRSGDKLETFTPDGALAVVGSPRKGNPEQLAP